MALHQRAEIETRDFAVLHDPPSSHHNAIGAVRAAQHEGGKRITAAGETRFVELEQREVCHLATAISPMSVRPKQAAEPFVAQRNASM